MTNTIRTVSMIAALGALAVVPAISDAAKPASPGKSQQAKGKAGQGGAKSQRCKKTAKRGFVVKGTLVSATADDPATTDVDEGSVTITVTNANSHARKSGELADQNADKKGVQVKGATFTATAANDAYKLVLSGYAAPDTPSAGDKVRITGRIPVTKKKCAATGTSLADRYGDPDIRRVKLVDSDPDA